MSIVLVLYYLSAPGAQASTISIIEQRAASSCNDLDNCRTLWNIIWSCLVTIFACTWVAVHPNIQGPDEIWIGVAARRLGITVMAVIAPELVIMWAMRQWMSARRLAKKYQKYKWTMAHGYFAIMGGFMLFDNHIESHTLAPWELEPYLKTGEIDITENEIQDKSRGDLLSKGLVVVQTGWFVLQCVARRVNHLPITGLELVTLAYATLNFVTYGLWWNKPLCVQCPYPVRRKPNPTLESNNWVEDEGQWEQGGYIGVVTWDIRCKMMITTIGRSMATTVRKMANAIGSAVGYVHCNGVQGTMWKGAKTVFKYGIESFVNMGGLDDSMDRAKRVPTFYSAQDATLPLVAAASCMAMVFGAIHCTAWSFEFPTHIEQRLWRISSLAITCLPLLLPLVAASNNWLENRLPGWVLNIFVAIMSPTLYILSRITLLGLAFAALRSLPAEGYRTVHWTTLIPHV